MIGFIFDAIRQTANTDKDVSTRHDNNHLIYMENTLIPSFNIIGISVRTWNQGEQAASDIAALWNEFFQNNLIHRIPNRIGDDVYCVYTEYEKDHTAPYTTILGCKVASLDDVPEDMDGIRILESHYKRFEAIGNLQQGAVYQTWQQIWTADLPRAYTADFEVYGSDSKDPKDAKVDIFIAIEE